MAEPTSVALAAAPIPDSADIARAEKFVRERFLHDGEDPAVALAAGTPRRRALDQALAELGEQAKHPSTAWRREFSLLLGLERVLSDDEPKLADGTVLSRPPGRCAVGHADGAAGRGAAQLPRTATAAPRPRPSCSPPPRSSAPTSWRRRGLLRGAPAPELRAPADLAGDEDEDDELDEEPRTRTTRTTTISVPSSAPRPTRTTTTRTRTTDDELEDELDPIARGGTGARAGGDSDEEPRDWVDEDDEEESLAEQPEDPNAAKRFWFEHATGAGKTVAALGFVEASQTGGVLILTHRRNLVDQFHGELRDRGYSKRIPGRCSWARTRPRVR